MNSGDTYVQFYLLHKAMRTKKHHPKYYCTVVPRILSLDLQLCFVNDDCVFRSYKRVLYVENVLFCDFFCAAEFTNVHRRVAQLSYINS